MKMYEKNGHIEKLENKYQIEIFCEPYRTYDVQALKKYFWGKKPLKSYRKYSSEKMKWILNPYKEADVVVLAAGLGGGLTSDFLLIDKKVHLLVSDIDLGVVSGWKHYLGKSYQGNKTIEFAVMNAGNLPLENESVDVVALYDAFGNLTCCEAYDVLQESYRVLRKGGKLITDYSYIMALDLNKTPKLDAFVGYRRIATDEYHQVGYAEVNTIIGKVKAYPNNKEKSSLSDCCIENNYQIVMRQICQVAVK